MKKKFLFLILTAVLALTACGKEDAATKKPAEKQMKSGQSAKKTVFQGEITLSSSKAEINTPIHYKITGLKPNQETTLTWGTVSGQYDFDGLYKFIGVSLKDKTVPLTTGKSSASGELEGDFNVPTGYGGNHTIYVNQAGKLMAQTNLHINPTFTISPASGPIGTEITITAEGIGYDVMERNWQLTYDNKLTGLITAITTNGKAVAKIRAAGPVGNHTLTIWHGYLGIPYVNHEQAPTSYLPVPKFNFTVTDGKTELNNYVEKVPEAAGGGVKMPALKNEDGVTVTLDKSAGVAGEPVNMTASGLPADKEVKLVFNTMRGSRVSGNGFGEKKIDLFSVKTDGQGSFTKSFPVPDDLGGIPHRIDLEVGGKTYGQTYLAITPSIVSVTPTSGPPGTPIRIEIKGVGWTEYDNTYDITYDNGYFGYVCGFNTAGSVTVNMIASGEPGYHLIDFYPGIYRGKQPQPDIYLAPQLTYGEDHPGSSIPAIRMGFTVTKP